MRDLETNFKCMRLNLKLKLNLVTEQININQLIESLEINMLEKTWQL